MNEQTLEFTQERIDELSAGYDLDSGGYEFQPIKIDGLSMLLQWDDPDPDYVPWIIPVPWDDYYAWDCPVYVFAPEDCDTKWPNRGWTDVDGDDYVLRGSGILYSTDHECYCEPKHRKWDKNRHETSCGRPGCIAGMLESAGGSWALYSIETDDDTRARRLRDHADTVRAFGTFPETQGDRR